MLDDQEAVYPYPITIPQDQLDDLKRRLATARWPEREPVADDSQGVRLARLQEVCRYWQEKYDWRRCEWSLNSIGSYITRIDGLNIHFLHAKSREPNALPIVLTHGWPGSVLEFERMVGPLTDPVAHGGRATEAFEVVVPSLPGFGFSERPSETGWGVQRIARAWSELARRLGFRRWVAQGNDFGADVSAEIGRMGLPGCIGIHLATLFFPDDKVPPGPFSPAARMALDKARQFQEDGYGYMLQMATRPQTIGYSLADSPVGLAAWLLEKIDAWSDPHTALSTDQILDNITLYWLTNTGASAARLYWESKDDTAFPIDIPVGVTIFRNDISNAPKEWVDPLYKRLVHWEETDEGGHFGGWERPLYLTEQIRATFRSVRNDPG